MNNGKRVRAIDRKKIFLVTALVLALCAVGGTIAWLATSSNSVTNTFTPAKVTNQIVETRNGTTKENVYVTNTGNTSAYVRAAIIINWVDQDNNIWISPEGAAYQMVLNTGSGADQWTEDKTAEGTPVYYYNSVVPVGGSTEELITSVKETSAPVGYHLQVTIVSESIQATGLGATSAQDAWAKAAQG